MVGKAWNNLNCRVREDCKIRRFECEAGFFFLDPIRRSDQLIWACRSKRRLPTEPRARSPVPLPPGGNRNRSSPPARRPLQPLPIQGILEGGHQTQISPTPNHWKPAISNSATTAQSGKRPTNPPLPIAIRSQKITAQPRPLFLLPGERVRVRAVVLQN
jgi:hypothetical protein